MESLTVNCIFFLFYFVKHGAVTETLFANLVFVLFLKPDLILVLTAIIPVSYKQVTFIAERAGTAELVSAHLQVALNTSVSSREYVAYSVIHISVIENETPTCRRT